MTKPGDDKPGPAPRPAKPAGKKEPEEATLGFVLPTEVSDTFKPRRPKRRPPPPDDGSGEDKDGSENGSS